MKRSLWRIAFALVLTLCLAAVLFAVPAYADYYDTLLEGDSMGRETVFTSADKITYVSSNYGELAPGLTLSKDNYNIYLSGTPTQPGTYECELWIDTESTPKSCVISLWVKERGARPTPTPAPAPGGLPYITKNPTGETVDIGGSATFVARADGADKIIWRLVSPDTSNTIEVQNASGTFPGLGVSGQGSEKLVLSNIPKELNKWCAECRFVNSAGSSFTNGAIITVRNASPTGAAAGNAGSGDAGTSGTNKSSGVKTPIINTQPKGANQEIGKSCTLTVKALSPDGAELSYQWYRANETASTKLVPIEGENGSTFTPPETEGTTQYCVAISAAKNGEYSETVYSSLASVTYSQPASVPVSETSAAPGEDTGAAQDAPGGDVQMIENQTGDKVMEDRYESGGLSVSVIFFALTGVLALAALVFILIYLKRSAERENELDDMDDDYYSSRPAAPAEKYSYDLAGEEAMTDFRKSQIRKSTKKSNNGKGR